MKYLTKWLKKTRGTWYKICTQLASLGPRTCFSITPNFSNSCSTKFVSPMENLKGNKDMNSWSAMKRYTNRKFCGFFYCITINHHLRNYTEKSCVKDAKVFLNYCDVKIMSLWAKQHVWPQLIVPSNCLQQHQGYTRTKFCKAKSHGMSVQITCKVLKGTTHC